MKLGVQNGKLTACPSSPNCVSSQASDAKHKIASLTFEGPSSHALQILLEVLESFPRAKIKNRQGDYIHATFTSKIFRFVDDVEFLIIPDKQRIDFRSASRIGYSDLGANRKRMEQIRKEFNSRCRKKIT